MLDQGVNQYVGPRYWVRILAEKSVLSEAINFDKFNLYKTNVIKNHSNTMTF